MDSDSKDINSDILKSLADISKQNSDSILKQTESITKLSEGQDSIVKSLTNFGENITKTIFDNTALVLGLAISIHTIYQIVSTTIFNYRVRIAMGESFRLKFENSITLIYGLSDQATRFADKYQSENKMEYITNEGFDEALERISTRRLIKIGKKQ